MRDTSKSGAPDPDGRGKRTSRYRKIEVRTWSDERFRDLSPIPPSGQGLWFFLLTGPHTGPIPGLFRAGRASMAEELNWELEAFDKAFAEVLSQGMVKADFKARFVWLPNAIRHNKPESPNVVTSWRVELDLLPECALKREAIEAIRDELVEIGPAFVEAFDKLSAVKAKPIQKALQLPFDKPLEKTSPNQEQDQEQDKQQDQDQQQQQEKPEDQPRGSAACAAKKVFEHWQKTMDHPQSKLDDKRTKLINSRVKDGYSVEDLCLAIDGCKLSPHHMGKNDSQAIYDSLELILRSASKVDWFVAKTAAAPGSTGRSLKASNTIANLQEAMGRP